MSENQTQTNNSSHRESTTPNDHSHRTVQQIVNELRISPFEKFLLWLAKTDYYVLYISTFKSRSNLAGLGSMVIFTALLAFISSFYALSSTLIGEEVSGRYFICAILSSVYTFGIVLIDREIVGATSSSILSTVARLIFAVVIATAVSYPAKLSFFDGRIDLEINNRINAEFQGKLDEIKNLKANTQLERQNQLQQLAKDIAQQQETIASTNTEYERELAVRGGIGPRSESLNGIMAEHRLSLQQKNEEFSRVKDSPIYSPSVEAQINKIEEEIAGYKRQAFDLLSKIQALNSIEKRDPAVQKVSWFMLLFFMLLELVPLALKWSLGSTEYHLYIEARNTLNKQKIASITNHYVEKMQQDRTSVFEVPREVTDLIAYVLEDEAKNVKQTGSFNESINSSYKKTSNTSSNTQKSKGDEPSPGNDETR